MAGIEGVSLQLDVTAVSNASPYDSPFVAQLQKATALALGRATRLIRFLPHEPKRYEGTLVLGVRTETDDVTGAVLERHDGPAPPAEQVRREAAALVGVSLQRPPRP